MKQVYYKKQESAEVEKEMYAGKTKSPIPTMLRGSSYALKILAQGHFLLILQSSLCISSSKSSHSKIIFFHLCIPSLFFVDHCLQFSNACFYHSQGSQVTKHATILLSSDGRERQGIVDIMF